MVKTPDFDMPRTRGVSSALPCDAYTFPVEPVMRVTVVYRGKQILMQVLRVVKPNDVFEGKVLEIDQAFEPLDELMIGDEVRFNHWDIHWIDAP